MRVILTDPAERDLEDIADFIAQDSPARADSFVDEILVRCLSLGEGPERYAVFANALGQAIRRCPHGAYLIFYAIVGDHVEVTRVIHSARDYARILFPDA